MKIVEGSSPIAFPQEPSKSGGGRASSAAVYSVLSSMTSLQQLMLTQLQGARGPRKSVSGEG